MVIKVCNKLPMLYLEEFVAAYIRVPEALGKDATEPE
jgi:hypothetical protein